MALLEGHPVITEDLLEGVFVNPLSVVCHGRWLYHTLLPGSTCLSSLPCAPPWSLESGEQGHQKRKFLYAQVNSFCSFDLGSGAAQAACLSRPVQVHGGHAG